MRRDEVVRQLRGMRRLRMQEMLLEAELDRLRQQLCVLEEALEQLTEDERDIIGTMLIDPRPLACEELCEKLLIERSAVYRRRDKALKKLEKSLPEMRDKSGTIFGPGLCTIDAERKA